MGQTSHAMIARMGFWVQVKVRAHLPLWPVFPVGVQRVEATGDPIAKQMGRKGWVHAPKPSAGPRSNHAPLEVTP